MNVIAPRYSLGFITPGSVQGKVYKHGEVSINRSMVFSVCGRYRLTQSVYDILRSFSLRAHKRRIGRNAAPGKTLNFKHVSGISFENYGTLHLVHYNYINISFYT